MYDILYYLQFELPSQFLQNGERLPKTEPRPIVAKSIEKILQQKRSATKNKSRDKIMNLYYVIKYPIISILNTEDKHDQLMPSR